MILFFPIFAVLACLSLAACSDEDEKVLLLEGIVKRAALNDSLKKEIIQSEIDRAALEARSDSLSKSGTLLSLKNNQLRQEVEKTKQDADKYRRDNERVQEEVGQLKEEIDQLQENERTNERAISRLAVEIDSISVDRDRLIGVNQDLKNELNGIREALNTVHRIQKSVRMLVGTESFLKNNHFLETGRNESLRKQYRLVKKLKVDDSRVKIVPLNQQLDLTLNPVLGALVERSGKLKLKALVDRHGKLKEGRDYIVDESRDTTIVTFINRILEGTDALAVVEVEN